MSDIDQHHLITSYLPSVEVIAKSVKSDKRTPRHAEVCELIGEGSLALVRAAKRYTARVKFSTYVEPRVRGQMLDFMRRCAWPNRYHRQAAEARGESIARMVPLTKTIAKGSIAS